MTHYVKGFTLIELLIAVLIIGVLAAIAVSAYQKAVLKSRFSSIIPPTKTIADAQEFYYMNNGSYATDVAELDITLKNNTEATLALSDKRNYKYVMGSHSKADKNHYIVYQKHSKRFANDVHCEAAKDDAKANWLCEKGLGGTLLTGSISGTEWLTYLLSGDGNGKFVREDCRAGQYDDNGTCKLAPAGHYADEGELKKCSAGTYANGWEGATECIACPAGQYSAEGTAYGCKYCPGGTISEEGSASCTECPAGTHANRWEGATECIANQ